VLGDIYRTFPDFRLETLDIVAAGDTVVVRARCSGTHLGTGKVPVQGGIFLGVAPTGKRFEVQHMHWYRLRDGKIVEHYACRDDVGQMQQLGLLPPPPAGATPAMAPIKVQPPAGAAADAAGRSCAKGSIECSIPARTGSRVAGYGQPLALKPSKAALMIVDMQRFFVETPLFQAMQRTVAPIARLLPVARAAGMTVVHLKTEFRPDMADAGRPGSRTRTMMAATGLVEGSAGAEIWPELAPDPSDHVVVKRCFSGFADTGLHALLSARGVETLLFAGGTTTVCVESTLRDGMFLGYNGVLLSDCTADMSEALHESALARIDLFFGWVCSSDDILASLVSDPPGLTP
jgi:ureidoacrylate peracid hydrolase